MKRAMIDTNVILDVFLKRDPFYEASAKTLNMIYDKYMVGMIPASCVTDIYYIAKRIARDKEKSYKAIDLVMQVLEICDVSPEIIQRACEIKADDFEDCVLAECAKENDCECIVTRNEKDFREFGVRCVTPEVFAEMIP